MAHDILKSEFKRYRFSNSFKLLSGVRDSLDKPTDYWKTNVIGTQRLFEHFRDTRIIYASSSTAHGRKSLCNEYSMEQLDHNNAVG